MNDIHPENNSHQLSSIENLLPIDDESDNSKQSSSIHANEELLEHLEPPSSPKLTKHTIVTSPWSRLVIIAVPFGLSFLAIFLLLNGVFNPAKQPIQIANQNTPSEAVSKAEQKDGDVYAKLALSQQETELSKINNPETQKPQVSNKTVKAPPATNTQPTPRPPRPRISRQPTNKTATIASSPQPPRSFTIPKSNPIAIASSTRAVDPIAELNRLRNIGSFGTIAYADNSVEQQQTYKESKPDNPLSNKRVEPSVNSGNSDSEDKITINSTPTPNSSDQIEKLRPRWEPENKSNNLTTVANNYLPQESQILQEKKTRYLTVGEFASGVLVTPVVKEQTDTRNDRQKTSDGRRFVAKLTEDLHDNNGDVAIQTGTLLAIEVISVDGGSYAQVEVTSIIKDKTEYPITKGAISVQGSGAKPLIAKKFHDKGGEIAQYDLTVGLIGGLGKVGEIINQPDSQSSIQNSSIGSFSSSVTQSSRRSIPGAFLEGAFGKLTDIVGNRAERSTQEILARPNVWYIPQGTKVTFLVNRTLELP